jgi:cytochrome c553
MDRPLALEEEAMAAPARQLFFDPRLSADATVSCGTCHEPEHGFTVATRVATGIGGGTGTFASPTSSVHPAGHGRKTQISPSKGCRCVARKPIDCVTYKIIYDLFCYEESGGPMEEVASEVSEQIQRMVAAFVATQPAGVGLRLVGGFRYRLLDRGVRRSVDIDYHWHGDLVAKQGELIAAFRRRLLPDVRRRRGRHRLPHRLRR